MNADKSENHKNRLADYYKIDPAKTKINIEKETYSNGTWINVSGRDVFVDFLRFPGVINDGIPVVTGVRVYMPFSAAQRLSEVLAKTLKSMIDIGGMEPIYAPDEPINLEKVDADSK